MEGAQNRQLQYKKPTFSGLKGQQKRSGVAGASAGPCFLKWSPKPSICNTKNPTFSYASGQILDLGASRVFGRSEQGLRPDWGRSQGGPRKVSGGFQRVQAGFRVPETFPESGSNCQKEGVPGGPRGSQGGPRGFPEQGVSKTGQNNDRRQNRCRPPLDRPRQGGVPGICQPGPQTPGGVPPRPPQKTLQHINGRRFGVLITLGLTP